jgi:hypothetical protein
MQSRALRSGNKCGAMRACVCALATGLTSALTLAQGERPEKVDATSTAT